MADRMPCGEAKKSMAMKRRAVAVLVGEWERDNRGPSRRRVVSGITSSSHSPAMDVKSASMVLSSVTHSMDSFPYIV